MTFDPSSLFKVVGVPAAMGMLGWTAHVIVDSYSTSKTVEQHSTQINQLWKGQHDLSQQVQEVHDSTLRIEGAVGQINQKIDDDRRYQARK